MERSEVRNAECKMQNAESIPVDSHSAIQNPQSAPPAGGACRVKKWIARIRDMLEKKRVREALVAEDQRLFEDDYAAHFDKAYTKTPDVGRPFLLHPWFPKGGIVLIHGYMAAPLEVRAMAEYLYQKRYAVYGVRLKGHGTSPADLANTHWEDWGRSIEHGYAVMRTITDNVILGGFSMGAGLALLAAGQKRGDVSAVFAIAAPLKLWSNAARLAPSMVRVNAWLKRFNWSKFRWEYVENDPENKHINYTSNPIAGVAELSNAMNIMEDLLKDITAPTIILQGSHDPVVHPDSGPAIFDKVGTPLKEYTLFARDRHGIINGPGAEEVFERVYQFLTYARETQRREPTGGAR